MNPTFNEDTILNQFRHQASSAAELNKIDFAAHSYNSPLAPAIGFSVDQSHVPDGPLSPRDINRPVADNDDHEAACAAPADSESKVAVGHGGPHLPPDRAPAALSFPQGGRNQVAPGLTTKQRRRLSRFARFVEDQDWRPGVTKQDQTYRSFLRAAALKIPGFVAAELVVHKIEKSGGDLVPDKVKRQLLRAYQYIDGQSASTGSMGMVATPKPAFRPEELARVAGKLEVEDIVQFVRDRSPMNPEQVDSAGFLSHVFERDEKVLIFSDMKSQGEYVWSGGSEEHDELPNHGEKGIWYLVNPVDGAHHWNPREKKDSRRSEEAITDFRHLVLESDIADPALWLKVLAQLPLKIVAIYSSAGKSVHALVKVSAASKKEWDEIRNKLRKPLITLGADQGAMSAVRLSRLPQASRAGKCQELFFLDPTPDGRPICTKEPRDRADRILAGDDMETDDVR